MSEKLASLKKSGGGGNWTETVLWTNPNRSVAFGNQTVNLSDNMNNYDYIKIVYYGWITSSDDEDVIIILPVEKLKFLHDATNWISLYIGQRGSSNYYRRICYDSDTSIIFKEASNTSAGIPYKIIGIK